MKIFRKYTLKSLTKNRTRTLVTIIGIILSAAMFAAVTTFVASLQAYMLNFIIATDGPWVGKIAGLPREEMGRLETSNEVSEVMFLENVGYAALADSQNDYKPYLFVGAYSQSFAKDMPIYLTSGRMPADSTEIILPDHLATNGGIKHQIGDVLELNLGYRVEKLRSGGQTPGTEEPPQTKLGQDSMFAKEVAADGTEEIFETLIPQETRTYTVVGFYERPTFEFFSAPGYTALTLYDSAKSAPDADYDAYFTMDNMAEVSDFLEDNFSGYSYMANWDLLHYSGVFSSTSINRTLYSMAGILMGIIMFASIALIYNAFSISVSERTKQFGLLSSIGATKKQLMSTVLFESLALSAIGIPLGLLSGYGGIAVTLRLTQNLFATGMGLGGGGDSVNQVPFRAVISWQALLIAAAICLITVLISAYIPAYRATKRSAIEAIRQSGDIRIKPGKVRTSKLTYYLFGFEGMIASKNFKRNKKKYRATVFSLFVSVVLFISASSFCDYLTRTVGGVTIERNYDIEYVIAPDLLTPEEAWKLYGDFGKIDTVTGSNLFYVRYGTVTTALENANTNPDFTEHFWELTQDTITDQATFDNVRIIFMEDGYYKSFLESEGLDTVKYLNAENPTALAICYSKVYEEGKFYVNEAFAKKDFTATWSLYPGYTEDGEELEAPPAVPVQIGEWTDACPMGLSENYGYNIMLLYPESARSQIDKEPEDGYGSMYFTSSNPTDTEGKMAKILEDRTLSTDRIGNRVADDDTEHNLILLVRIFSTGFIVLISLISAANVFNTISTNINLRRREFAMLKSMGMTNSGFNKMMNYECLLYGIKGLIYGIPAALGVTYLIYRSMRQSIDIGFFVPAYSIIIAVGSVFLVVFATMLYSMRKVKKENTVDALKTEVF